MSARSCGLVAALLLFAGCADPPEETPGVPGSGSVPVAPGEPGDVGSISMALTVGGGVQINQISYAISGNGFQKAGTIDVSASTTVTTTIGGIPVGVGYQVQLTAQDVAHKLLGCAGAATFDVLGAATVPVPVHLTCHEAPRAPAAAVPVPGWARAAMAGLLLGLGLVVLRRRDRAPF
jgi:hypothetical protein